MGVEKLSISMDASLAKLVRQAAEREGITLSTWLAEAAVARARQHALREALVEYAKVHGVLPRTEAERLVADARSRSRVVRPKKSR
jgi:hypothetical protein